MCILKLRKSGFDNLYSPACSRRNSSNGSIIETRKPIRPKGVEKDASARSPNLSSPSSDLEL